MSWRPAAIAAAPSSCTAHSGLAVMSRQAAGAHQPGSPESWTPEGQQGDGRHHAPRCAHPADLGHNGHVGRCEVVTDCTGRDHHPSGLEAVCCCIVLRLLPDMPAPTSSLVFAINRLKEFDVKKADPSSCRLDAHGDPGVMPEASEFARSQRQLLQVRRTLNKVLENDALPIRSTCCRCVY